MNIQTRALLVHFLTATGAVFAMLALLEAVKGNWPMMTLWLVVAFAVDGVDGPLARKYDVKTNAPRFDGVLLDLIIDYLTYVFIPAYALFASHLLPGWTGWFAILIINFASALYFADTRMKTADNSFQGFPGCWNMVVFVFLAAPPPVWLTLAVVVALSVMMFLPLKFIHPVRTARWRKLSLPMALLWTGFAGFAAWHSFVLSGWIEALFIMISLYLLFAGIAQQVFPVRRPA